MKTLLTLTVMLALAGCSAQEEPKRGGKHSEAERAAAFAAEKEGKAGKAADTVAPTSVPASYEVFPAEVRTDIYRWDLLNQKCGGRFRTKGEDACEEADKLTKQLLAKGWCFGGSDEPASAHWLLCAQDYPGGEGWVASPNADPTKAQ